MAKLTFGTSDAREQTSKRSPELSVVAIDKRIEKTVGISDPIQSCEHVVFDATDAKSFQNIDDEKRKPTQSKYAHDITHREHSSPLLLIPER